MTIDELLHLYGTQAQAAKTLGWSQQAVSKWVVAGRIPFSAQVKIERKTKGLLRAQRFSETRINGK